MPRYLTRRAMALTLAATLFAVGCGGADPPANAPAAESGEQATTLTGTWQGEMPNGTQIRLDVVAADGALTGTLMREGETFEIVGGKATGGSFTFSAMLNGRSQTYSGKFAGGAVQIWNDRRGAENALTLKRAS